MARPLRIEYPGALYHVTSRMVGNWRKERNELFVDDADHERFLVQLAERVERFQVSMFQYCLMTNHVHLVFETPQGNASAFMQSLSTAYSVYYNRRHQRHGHLFDGRFGGKLVEKNDYLLALSRYVHLNPAKTEARRKLSLKERRHALRRYRWSSYPQYIGLRKKKDWVHYNLLLRLAGGRGKQAPPTYRRFVELGLSEDDEEFQKLMRESRYAIGSEAFQTWVDETQVAPRREERVREDLTERRLARRCSPELVLEVAAALLDEEPSAFKERRRNSVLRPLASRLLVKYAGLSQREVASYLGLTTGAAVSAHLRKSAALMTEAGFSQLVDKVEKELDRRSS